MARLKALGLGAVCLFGGAVALVLMVLVASETVWINPWTIAIGVAMLAILVFVLEEKYPAWTGVGEATPGRHRLRDFLTVAGGVILLGGVMLAPVAADRVGLDEDATRLLVLVMVVVGVVFGALVARKGPGS